MEGLPSLSGTIKQLLSTRHGRTEVVWLLALAICMIAAALSLLSPCSPNELDAFEYWPARLPYAPQGAVDGKVMDSDLAADLSFWARWGSSSGMGFDADEFLIEHPQWNHLDAYLKDRPSQPWALFSAGEE